MINAVLFSLFFLMFLYLGMVYVEKKNLKWFFICAILLPITSSLTAIHTKAQVNIYYAFLIFPLFFFSLQIVIRRAIPRDLIVPLLTIAGLITFYLPFGIVEQDKVDLIAILKDIKPLVFLLLGMFAIYWFKGHRLGWYGKTSYNLLKYNCWFSLVYFIILTQTNIIRLFSADAFYLTSEIRYLSMGTFYAVFYAIAKMASRKRFRPIELLYVVIPLLLSGNRTILLVMAVLLVINTFLSLANPKLFLRRAGLVAISFVGLLGGVLVLNEELKARIVTLLNPESLINELMEKRFSPFFLEIKEFSWYNYLIGKGIGDTFFIPWFVYRENIDDYNTYMDNVYLTLYVKYGLGMFIIFGSLIWFINRVPGNLNYKILVLSYFLLMGLTTAFFYQNSFLFILLLLAAFTQKDSTIRA